MNDCATLDLKRPKSIALKLLARREHSKKELKQKLQKKGFSSEQITLVLTELIKQGWQSDDRFADCYIRSRISAGFGPLRIAFELNQRGVQGSLIEKYLRKDDVRFWMAQLTRVHARRFKLSKTDQSAIEKRYRFLQGRGFMHDCIMLFLKGNNNEYQ